VAGAIENPRTNSPETHPCFHSPPLANDNRQLTIDHCPLTTETRMPAPIRAVVFDLDGLMFDTEALFFRVSSDMLAARGKAFTAEIMRAMIGRRAVDAGHVLKTMTGLDEPVEVLLADVRRRFYAQMDAAVHPTPGLFVLLDRLRSKGVPLAVATSSRHSYADRLLNHHRLASRFEFVLAAEDVTQGKPDPEIYLKAIERFALPSGSVMVLEDSSAGVAAGHASGAFVVGIPHEHSPAEALAAADLIVPRLDDPGLLSRFDRPHGE
jgi:HAD superfamily hydrolase (TIGR01509 family)